MNKWKKISILKGADYETLFSENHGLIRINSIDVRPVDEAGKPYPKLYTNKNPYGQSNPSERYAARSFSVDTVFSDSYYVTTIEKLQQTGYRYRYSYLPDTIPAVAAECVNPCYLITINFYVKTYSSSCRAGEQTARIEKLIKDKSELDDLKIWATTDEVVNYKLPATIDLKIGQEYLYVGKGLCKVLKVYDYPKRGSHTICKIRLLSGETQDVALNDTNFVLNPMAEFRSEFEQFNESLNELQLQPLVSKRVDNNLINVIWQPIADAARYVVKLYRYIDSPDKRKVYFLKDFDLDRNEYLLRIDNLIVNKLIVVVTAENRSGEIIAKSRGIDVENGSPQWWN